MGSSVGGNKGFVSEINVTPFVDVMLVLLIIFMVTAPMMTEGLDVDLPQTRAVETLPTESDNMILTVRKDGAIFLDSYEVGLDELPADLREAAVLRLENPEMSLREMGERLSISRSGVNHRLRRILEFAEQLGSPEESLAEQSVFEVEEKLHAENAKTEEL